MHRTLPSRGPPVVHSLGMEDMYAKSPSISLLCSTASTPIDDSNAAEKIRQQNLFLPLTEELQPRFPAHVATPVDTYMASQGPLITPDACPFLNFEDDRRVRFRDSDEEWLLTEEISVDSASVRCSENVSTAEASAANPEAASPDVVTGHIYSPGTERKCLFTTKGAGPGKKSQGRVCHSHACSSPQEDTSEDYSFDYAVKGVSKEGPLVRPTVLHHFWWSAGDDNSGVDCQQQFSTDVTAPGPKIGARKSRRHTAPGVLKTALIRSADGSLRRRRLHSPPCLTTSHPPKSCVRMQSEGSITGFQTFGSQMSIGSMNQSVRSTSADEEISMYMPDMGYQTEVVPFRRLRTFSGPRFSSLVVSSPFRRRTKTHLSHVSQPGALVDIAALEVD